MSTIDALSRGPKYMSDSNGLSAGQDSRLDYLASPELVDILTRFMLGGRSPRQVEEGVTHPMDPNRDRTTYLSQQPPPTDILGSAMQRGDPLAWMEQVVEPEGTPEPSLIETLASKAPQLAEQVAIMAGAAKGAGGMRGQPRMAWEPQFGTEKLRPASPPRGPSSDTVRVYSGGQGSPSDFWSENPGRAASYGPNVWVVEIPRSVFEAGKEQARKSGQPTKWDTVLPNEWIKKASQVPSENLGK